MKKLVFFIAFVVPAGIYAQCERLFSVEAGVCTTAPFKKNFHVEEGGSRGGYNWTGTIQSLPSYYVKAGIEKSFQLCGKSRISFPFSLAYYNLANKISMYGSDWGCFVGFTGKKDLVQNNHTAAYSLGIKFVSRLTEKFSWQKNLNFGQSLLLTSENNGQTESEYGIASFHYYNTFQKLNFFLTDQTAIY
jgi:hypothetical protein